MPSHASVSVDPLDDGWAVKVMYSMFDLGQLMYLYVYFETGVDQLIQITDRPVQGEYSVRDIADTLLGPEDTSCDCYYLDFDLQRTIPARFEIIHDEPIRLLLGTNDTFTISP